MARAAAVVRLVPVQHWCCEPCVDMFPEDPQKRRAPYLLLFKKIREEEKVSRWGRNVWEREGRMKEGEK